MTRNAADLLTDIQAALPGRFTLERPIGRGGMATVFLGRERHPDRPVAIKVMHPELSLELGRERFVREVEIASSLTHPHIVPILSAGEAGGFLYYVMPYIVGRSLRQRLQDEGTLPLEDALHITQDVADALAYAHRADVIHRDVKPENIMLTGGHAVVTDFGIARALSAAGGEHLTIAGLPIGTPGYMSPEQATGAPDLDGRTDVYSLASVLFEMLQGERPFPGESLRAVVQAQQTGPRAVPTGTGDTIPDGIWAAIQRALAWERDQRFATAAEFSAALTTPGVRPSHTAQRLHPSASGAAPQQSVAVLPFANMSADPENEYFSDGITDDIITNLSKINGLKVTSRTSAMRFKGTKEAIGAIAQQLAVRTVLEGSVRRAGNRVRITAQLIDAVSDSHLWAETYDRDLTDLFEIQSDVAHRIAEALEARLSPDERERIDRKPTQNLDAYTLYLEGGYHWNRFTPTAQQRALESFEKAIALDPDFALAYEGLASAYFTIAISEGLMDPAVAFRYAKEAAESAIRIDHSLTDAHATLGSYHTWYSWDWTAAKDAFQQAFSVGCGCEIPTVKYAFYLAARGEHDEAVAHATRAAELDPVSVVIGANVGLQLYLARRYDKAEQQLHATLNLDDGFPPGHSLLGWVLLQTNRPELAIERFQRAIALTSGVPTAHAGLGAALAAAGRTGDAHVALDTLQRLSEQRPVSPRDFAIIHAALGEVDQALTWLERAVAQHAPWLCFVNVDPLWQPVRGDARFDTIVSPVGLARG